MGQDQDEGGWPPRYIAIDTAADIEAEAVEAAPRSKRVRRRHRAAA